MSKTTEYAKSENGLVHVVTPATQEHTLCGDAFDISSEGEEGIPHAWKPIKRGPVTCPDCARVIEACRGVQIRIGSNAEVSDGSGS